MAEIESKYELDVTSFLASIDQVAAGLQKVITLESQVKNSDPFKEAAKGAGNLDKEISSNTKNMVAMQATLEAYKEEVKKLTLEHETLAKKMKDVDAAGKHDGLKKELEEVRDRLSKVNTNIGDTTQKVGGLKGVFSAVVGKVKELTAGVAESVPGLSRFGSVATGVFGTIVIAIGAAVVGLYKIREGYLAMNDAMLVSTGNQKDVTNNMEVLDTLASQLDMTLRSVTSAYGTLTNEGLKPTKEQMRGLGILSQELKTDFTELSAAIVAADKGQVDSLRKLGVQAQVHGDKIKLSFRGVTTSFTKGSGDSVKALDQISKQMQKTENSADGLGRTDFLDRLAKGFVDAEQAVEAAAEKTDTKAYPAFDRLFKLIDKGKGYVLDMAEAFGIWLGVGWENIKNEAMIIVATLSYLPDALKNGLAAANKNLSVAKNAFLKNRKEIFEQEARLKANIGKDQDGELVNNGNKLLQDPKEDPGAKARRSALLKAEKDLQDALLKLQSEYGKDKLEALKGDYLLYLEEKKKLQLLEVDLEEKALLKLKQIAVGARKGRFDQDNKPIADTSVTLSEDERKPFDFRRGLIGDQTEMEKAKFINDNEKAITQMLSNEYQKQLQAVEYKYEELFKLAKQSGIDIANLEKQKAKDLAKIELDNNLAQIDAKSTQEMNDAEINVIKAQITGRLNLEVEARKGLLEVEKKFILQKIALLEASATPEAKAALSGLYKAVAAIDLDLSNLTKAGKKDGFATNFLRSLGLDEDGIEKALDAADIFAESMKKSIGDLYQTLNKMSENRINRIDQEISKKQEQVDKETELNEQGAANNLNLRLKEMEDLKNARERALKDQQRLQKAQLLVDTATQASSMISASAKVFAGFSGIPVIGVGLGIAAVALMLGAFAAAKIKAFQLIKQQGADKYEDGGEVGGRRHSEGGTIIEAEKGEYVTNRKSTAKYYDLIESINQDNKSGIMDYLLKDLLAGTGVGMSEPDRREAMQFMRNYHSQVNKQDNEVVNEIKNLRAELKDIKKGTNKISDKHFVYGPDGKLVEIGPNHTIVRDLGKTV